jgi:hypothetical protein
VTQRVHAREINANIQQLREAILRQYEMVRVVSLTQPSNSYDGWRINQRPPEIGEVGVQLDILHAEGSPDLYVVEMSGTDGVTIWLCDFARGELLPANE